MVLDLFVEHFKWFYIAKTCDIFLPVFAYREFMSIVDGFKCKMKVDFLFVKMLTNKVGIGRLTELLRKIMWTIFESKQLLKGCLLAFGAQYLYIYGKCLFQNKFSCVTQIFGSVFFSYSIFSLIHKNTGNFSQWSDARQFFFS